MLLLGLYLYQGTQSLWAFAAAFVSDFVIAILIQGVAGRLVDQQGARRVLILSSLVCACVFIPLSFFVAKGGSNVYLLILLLSLIHNAARPFLRSALFSAIPNTVPADSTQELNAKLAITLQIGQIAGGILAGIGLEWFSYTSIFITLGILYLLAAFSYWGLPRLDDSASKPKQAFRALATIKHLLRTEKTFVCLAVIGAIDFTLVGLLALFVAPTIELHFNGQPRWLLYIELAFALGAFLAGLMATRLRITPNHNWRVTAVSSIVAALVFYELSTQINGTLLLFLVALMGFFTSWASVVWVTTLQLLAPKEYLGSLGAIRLCVNAIILGLVTIIVSAASDISFYHGASVAMIIGTIFSVVAFVLNQLNIQRLQNS